MCYNELRIRGFSKDLIAQTVGSSNNQWQVSQSPELYRALSNKLFR